MNRSFTNVLFGAVGAPQPAAAQGDAAARTVIHYTPEDAAYILEEAPSVIIVLGYGMAVAQAQHVIQEAGNALTTEESAGALRHSSSCGTYASVSHQQCKVQDEVLDHIARLQ